MLINISYLIGEKRKQKKNGDYFTQLTFFSLIRYIVSLSLLQFLNKILPFKFCEKAYIDTISEINHIEVKKFLELQGSSKPDSTKFITYSFCKSIYKFANKVMIKTANLEDTNKISRQKIIVVKNTAQTIRAPLFIHSFIHSLAKTLAKFISLY